MHIWIKKAIFFSSSDAIKWNLYFFKNITMCIEVVFTSILMLESI